MTEREPDISDDPREQGTAEGYPESNPAETTPVEGTEQGPEAGSVPPEGEDAPQSAPDRDEGPGEATGNPDAAGGSA